MPARPALAFYIKNHRAKRKQKEVERASQWKKLWTTTTVI
jgi:hypothetical protein